MVVADINLLCVGQKHVSNFQIPNANILFYNRNNIAFDLIYHGQYEEIQKMNGIWYQIEPHNRLKGDYQHEFLDLCVESGEPRILFLEKHLKTELIHLINQMIVNSPAKMVCFFAYLQGYSSDIIYCSNQKFFDLMEKGHLYFNKVYYITPIE